jgi:sterol 3beta-glucosyltransferase
VVGAGGSGLNSGALPDSLFRIGPTPHAWLFAPMAGVVHHGGAGTTAMGLQAGRR